MDYTDYAYIKQMLDEYENIGGKKSESVKN